MGRKRTGTRQYVHILFAGLILCSLAGCSLPANWGKKTEPEEMPQRLLRLSREQLAQGNFDAAARVNQALLGLNLGQPPEDEALFNLGLIFGHAENPSRNDTAALDFFNRLDEKYPQSPWAGTARALAALIKEKEQLTREMDKLSREVNKFSRAAEEEKISRSSVEPSFPSAGRRDELREGLLSGQALIAQGNYDAAIREFQQVLSQTPAAPPGDEALFFLGAAFAHPGNPKRDYAKSLGFFKKLLKEYPQGPWADQARAWIAMIQENEKAAQTVDRLTRTIEQYKQVDLEIEELKKGKAR
jgi:TolA-binding protein